jgi:hypothetical protein
MEAWRASMGAAFPKQKKGCFKATYPKTEWEEVPWDCAGTSIATGTRAEAETGGSRKRRLGPGNGALDLRGWVFRQRYRRD